MDCILRNGHRGGKPLLLGRDRDDAIGPDLCHPASCRFRFEVPDEQIEIDIVANMKTDVHHAGESRAHVVEWLSESVGTAHGLLGIAILKQFDHDIVELDETNIQTLRAASQVWKAHRARIDIARSCLDYLVCQQRVVDAFALKIAVAHDLGAAEHRSVELVCALHVLHGEPEMLDATEPRAK